MKKKTALEFALFVPLGIGWIVFQASTGKIFHLFYNVLFGIIAMAFCKVLAHLIIKTLYHKEETS